MKKLVIAAGVVALLAVVVAAFAMWRVERYMAAPVRVPADGTSFEIAPGSSFSSVTGALVEAGIIDDDTLLRLYARWTGEEGDIQAGEYRIESGATPRTILEQFTRGAVQLHSFTIVEGWNHRDLLAALQAHDTIAAPR